VIYLPDKFGGVKVEMYTQTRLADGDITLDYSEHYLSATRPPPSNDEDEIDEDETDEEGENDEGENEEGETEEQPEDAGNSQTDASEKEEVLTEEEKKGFCFLLARPCTQNTVFL